MQMEGNYVTARGNTERLDGAGLPVPDANATYSQKLIIEAKNRGRSFADIADMYDITPEEAYRIWLEGIESSQRLTEAEYRMLQLERLEKLIDALWPMVVNDDNIASIDHTKVLLSVLQEISKMLGLHKGKAEQAVQVIDQRQVHLVVNYVDVVTEVLKREVLSTVTAKKARAEIEEKWDNWVAEASERPLERIAQETIEV